MPHELNHQVIFLPYLKRNFGLALCPDSSSEADTHVQIAVDQLRELEGKSAELMADRTLTEIGRNEKLRARREEATATVARCFVNLGVYGADVKEREAEFYGVPSIPPTHSAEAVIDGEIRHWIRTLPGD